MGKGNTSTAHVVITMEGKQAVDIMKIVQSQAQKTRKELEAMEKAGKIDTEDYKQKAKELASYERAIKANRTAYIDLDRTVKNLNKTTLRDLQRSLKECRKQMQNLSADDPKMKKLMTQYRAIDNQIGQITGQFKRQQGVLEGLVKRLSAYVLVYSGFNFVKSQLTDVLKQNVAFSDSLADIRKVTGMTSDEVNELSNALHGLDTRTTSEGLHELAYEAGKIGLKSTQDILGFVKAGNQIKVALGEDLGDNALVELMKMSEVMGTTKSMGVEKSLLAIGSSINELAASSTASGEDINGFAKRLSGVAAQANITTDQLLGLGSASSAMNMEVEVAATAFNKFINQIVAKTDVVAKAAGIEFEILDEMIRSGQTMEATVLVLEKLGEKGGLRALGPIMGDLGSNGSRLNNVLATFSQNVDILKTHLNTSSTAFQQATSVTNEYNIKNENAAAIIARMGNAIKEKFVNSGVTEWITNVLRSLYELPKVVDDNKGKIIAAIIAITAALTGLDARLAAINIRFTKMGLLRMLATLKGGITSLIAPLRTVVGLIIANPWTAATAAVGIFAGAFIDAAKKVDYMGKAVKRVKKLTDEGSESVNKEILRVTQLFEWLKRTKEGTEEYNTAKQTILSNYGQYLKGLDNEIARLQNIEGAYRAIIKAASDAAKMRMAEKALGDAGDAYATNTSGVYKEVYSILRSKQELVETEDLKGKKKSEWVQKYSKEEIDNIVSQIRTAIDTGSEVSPEIQAIIDSIPLQLKSSPTNRMGIPKEEWVNPLKDQMLLLRNAKTAYDYELAEIEEMYGLSLKDILAGGTNNQTTVPPLGGGAENLSEAKKQQQAVLAALETFYKQQEQVINQQYLDREITATEREKRLADIEKRMLESRIAARLALLNDPGAQEAWSAELQRMSDENIATSDENATALATLYGKNLFQIGEDLRKFGDGEMDGIRKNMEQDRITIQTNAVKMLQELEQILLKNDFTGKVTQQYMEAMQKLGIFFPEMEEDMKASAEWLMQGLHEIYPKIFDVDILTDAGLNAFRNMILNAKGATVEMAMMGEEQMRLLYYQILEYGDAMENANRQARKAGQRVTEEKWRKSGGLATTNRLSAEEKHINSMNSMLSGVGLMSDEVANDALIELYAKRVEALEKLRDLTIQNNGDIEDANKKLEEAMNQLSEAVVDKTLTMLETLKSFTDTLPEFGDALGEAFATEDATERMEALQEATKDFVQDLGEATKEMIVQWVKQKIQHALLKKSMVSTEKQTQGEITDTQQEGTEAQTAIAQVGGTLMQNIASKVKDFVVGKKKEQAAESVSTEASETSANATMGIASGAAKTVGELGWWGIPLVAVITALLNGLLSYAMGKVGNLFSGKSADSPAAPAGKVVSGMLAYDSGNVQSVLGSDGNTYSARVGGIGSGSGLVSVPTLTNVGGQAALVGEQGPEIVIGRATTRALMQNNSGLLQGLIQFDRLHSGRGFRTYDNGNIGEFGMGTDGGNNMADTIARMNQTIDNLSRQLSRGIHANVVRKELVEETVNGMYEEKQRGSNKNLKRLLG